MTKLAQLLNPKLKYDFVLPSPRAFQQMKASGLLSKLNHGWLPNVVKNLRPGFDNMAFDPGWQYTIVYGLGFAGYFANTSFVDKNDKRWSHLPYFRHYDQVEVNLDHGDRWFCTEKEAIEAGFERARE